MLSCLVYKNIYTNKTALLKVIQKLCVMGALVLTSPFRSDVSGITVHDAADERTVCSLASKGHMEK